MCFKKLEKGEGPKKKCRVRRNVKWCGEKTEDVGDAKKIRKSKVD